MTTKTRLILAGLVLVGTLTVVTGLFLWSTRNNPDTQNPASATAAQFIGSESCASCHQTQTEHWQSSDHHAAMATASEQSVLGNFNNSRFNYFGRQTTFSRQADQFLVSTENQQGAMETFTVAYTLGYKPLQQYLVKFADGRIQTLPFAWDTRSKAQGGQRWFHIYPNDNIKPENPLFWTRPMQNWNHMCADCHTTNFAKNFSDAKNSFDSQWSEIGNGCESCHGAGSAHAELMKQKPDIAPDNLLINKLATQTAQMDQCGVCHARRSRLQENPSHEKMLATWQPDFLHDNLYFTDGQMHDEVFNVGSFMQSKMYAAGVTCSNCHDAHSNKLKIEGNGLCTQCHSKVSYDSKQHHFHADNSAGSLCVNCHMPTQTYMVVDPRHDHSFPIPRPDLSIKLGGTGSVPNTCVSCHQDKMHQKGKDSHWAAAAVSAHLKKIGKNPPKQETAAEAFWQARREQLAAESSLKQLLADNRHNAIIKATALLELGNYLNPTTLELIKTQLADPDALVRLAAVITLAAVPAEQRTPLLLTMLNDDVLALRLTIAPLLAELDKTTLSAAQQNRLAAIFTEYTTWLLADADRGNALVSLANFYLLQGEPEKAKTYFAKALQRDEKSLAVLLNYADYYRHLGNDPEAEKLLRKAIVIYPDSPDAHYATGLLLVRTKNYPAAMAELAQARSLAPHNSQYVYVYALGLYSTGSIKQAMTLLAKGHDQFPANPSFSSALLAYCAEQQADPDIQKRYCASTPTRN